MRTTGQVASSGKRFSRIMNIPPPPKLNTYGRHNKALEKAPMAVPGWKKDS